MNAKTISLIAALCSAPIFAADDDAASTAKPAKAETPAPAAAVAPAPALKDDEIVMNFKNAPLDQVLNYMSEAAGFIIHPAPGVDLKGKTVNAWGAKPMSKKAAIDLLNIVLADNNLVVVRAGDVLTIDNKAKVRTSALVPTEKGNKAEKIDPTQEMVTQIIPVQYANAANLIQNLQPLLPEESQNGLSVNESGNAVILTAPKAEIKRMVEIISALDTSISGVSSIKVFPLKYADSKELVNAVKELFAPPQQQQQQRGGGFFPQIFGGGNPFGGGGNPFGGGGPGGGGRGNFGGGGGRGGNTAAGNTSQTASRVVAVADERSNSLIVSASDEAIPTIEKLVKEIDVPVDDITELKVFPLVNSDPSDIVDILQQIFPDETTAANNGNQQARQFQFGGRGFGGFGGGGPGGFGGGGGGGNRGGQQNASSDRMKKQGKVIAVADERTASVIVSAARDLMPEIEKMVKQIDGVRAKQKRVHVIPVRNADVADVETVVRDMFDRSGQMRNNNNNQNNALNSRQQQNIQQQGQQNNGFGGQGFGGGGGATGAFGR